MKRTLERLVSGIKRFGLSSAVSATLIASPPSSTQRKESERYIYVTQSQSTMELNSPFKAKKGLALTKDTSKLISSIGNYSEPIPNDGDFYHRAIIEISGLNNSITFDYQALPNPVQRIRAENPSTHIYLVAPEKIEFTGPIQRVNSYDYRKKSTEEIPVVPLEDTSLAKKLEAANEIYSLLKNKEVSGRNTLDESLNIILDELPAKISKPAKKGKEIIEHEIDKAEQRRLEGLERKYGPSFQIFKIPFYNLTGKNSIKEDLGRQTTFFFDETSFKGPERVYLVAPNISWRETATSKIASLEDLTYGVEITGTRRQTEIYGTWTLSPPKGLENVPPQKFHGKLIVEKDGSKVDLELLFSKGDLPTQRVRWEDSLSSIEENITTIVLGNYIQTNAPEDILSTTHASLELLGPNTLLFTPIHSEGGKEEVGDTALLSRAGSMGQPATLEDFYGLWEPSSREFYNYKPSKKPSQNSWTQIWSGELSRHMELTLRGKKSVLDSSTIFNEGNVINLDNTYFFVGAFSSDTYTSKPSINSLTRYKDAILLSDEDEVKEVLQRKKD